jgi:hypothetical protein
MASIKRHNSRYQIQIRCNIFCFYLPSKMRKHGIDLIGSEMDGVLFQNRTEAEIILLAIPSSWRDKRQLKEVSGNTVNWELNRYPQKSELK